MIIVHHLENSRSQRILWMLEELGLRYEVRRYERNKTTMLAPPDLKRVHPLGKSPVIEDDGKVVAETGAIVEYLVDKADGRLGPPATRDGALRYRFWLPKDRSCRLCWSSWCSDACPCSASPRRSGSSR